MKDNLAFLSKKFQKETFENFFEQWKISGLKMCWILSEIVVIFYKFQVNVYSISMINLCYMCYSITHDFKSLFGRLSTQLSPKYLKPNLMDLNICFVYRIIT